MVKCQACSEKLCHHVNKRGVRYLRHTLKSKCRSLASNEYTNDAWCVLREVLKSGSQITVILCCDLCKREEETVFCLDNTEDVLLESKSEVNSICIVRPNGQKDVRGSMGEYDFVEVLSTDILNMINNTVSDTRSICQNCYGNSPNDAIDRLTYELRISSIYSRILCNAVNRIEFIKRIIQIATFAQCEVYCRRFFAGGFRDNSSKWRQFVSYGKCARCYRSCSTGTKRPYCDDCVRVVRDSTPVCHYKNMLNFVYEAQSLLSVFAGWVHRGPVPIEGYCRLCNHNVSQNILYINYPSLIYWYVCYECVWRAVHVTLDRAGFSRRVHAELLNDLK
jgi:hypothetical protein